MRKALLRSPWTMLASAALVLILTFVWIGCEDTPDSVVGPISGTTDTGSLAKADHELTKVMRVQDRHTEELMAKRGVVGTATGLTPDGRVGVLVLTRGDENLGAFPLRVDGVPLVIKEVGEIVALQGKGNGKNKPKGDDVDPTARFDRPVPIGVSTGHPDITAGTIGCRVTDGTNVYALSNNHVYADENNASIGDAVIQPGTFDGGSSPADDIGTLNDFDSIVFSTSANNTIDAAIALSSTGNLGNATPSDGYGTPKSTTVEPRVNQKVKKYGRTTSLTKGIIAGINATLNVGYDSGTARFVDQIVVQGNGVFILGGDSGSLLVGDHRNDKNKPVGLLYAGTVDGMWAIANPIDDVLTRFGVTVDGE